MPSCLSKPVFLEDDFHHLSSPEEIFYIYSVSVRNVAGKVSLVHIGRESDWEKLTILRLKKLIRDLEYDNRKGRKRSFESKYISGDESHFNDTDSGANDSSSENDSNEADLSSTNSSPIHASSVQIKIDEGKPFDIHIPAYLINIATTESLDAALDSDDFTVDIYLSDSTLVKEVIEPIVTKVSNQSLLTNVAMQDCCEQIAALDYFIATDGLYESYSDDELIFLLIRYLDSVTPTTLPADFFEEVTKFLYHIKSSRYFLTETDANISGNFSERHPELYEKFHMNRPLFVLNPDLRQILFLCPPKIVSNLTKSLVPVFAEAGCDVQDEGFVSDAIDRMARCEYFSYNGYASLDDRRREIEFYNEYREMALCFLNDIGVRTTEAIILRLMCAPAALKWLLEQTEYSELLKNDLIRERVLQRIEATFRPYYLASLYPFNGSLDYLQASAERRLQFLEIILQHAPHYAHEKYHSTFTNPDFDEYHNFLTIAGPNDRPSRSNILCVNLKWNLLDTMNFYLFVVEGDWMDDSPGIWIDEYILNYDLNIRSRKEDTRAARKELRLSFLRRAVDILLEAGAKRDSSVRMRIFWWWYRRSYKLRYYFLRIKLIFLIIMMVAMIIVQVLCFRALYTGPLF